VTGQAAGNGGFTPPGRAWPVLYAPSHELIGTARTERGAIGCASGISRLACERMTARLDERWVDDGQSFTLAGLMWFVGPQLIQGRRR
jgi:hypothetical protein